MKLNISRKILQYSIFLLLAGCAGNKNNTTLESDDTIFSSEEESEEMAVDPKLRLKYQPRLQEYNYSFDTEIITQSADMTNGDWESRGYTSNPDVFINKLAPAIFNGIDMSDRFSAYPSKIYDKFFRAKSVDNDSANRSIQMRIFRHPETGMPMLAINGQLVNSDRMNIYCEENGKEARLSFQCLTEKPILNLDEEDSDYPRRYPQGLFFYVTKNPNYWYPRDVQTSKQINAKIDNPKGYSERELHYAKRQIEELEEGTYAYYQAIRKKEAIDPENNDYQKYFYIDITFHNCDQDPSANVFFDGSHFALVLDQNRPKVSEIPLSELAWVEANAFGTYTHKVVANNNNIDPTNIGASVAASNLGLYGKSEVAREAVDLGWDIFVDNEFYGRIFETHEISDGLRFYLFRNGEPNHIEVMEIPTRGNFDGKVIVTRHRNACHLVKIEEEVDI